MFRPIWTSLLLLGCAEQGVKVYNSPPGVSIISPAGGEDFAGDALIELIARADDAQDGPEALEVNVISSLDGVLGQDPPDASGDIYLPLTGLSAGPHVITVSVVDSGGESAEDSVNFTVGGGGGGAGAPIVLLAGPASGDQFVFGEEVRFVGKAEDTGQAWDTLRAALVSSRDGTFWEGSPTADGRIDAGWSALSVGTHQVTLSVQDDDGNIGTDEVDIEILEDGRPSVRIDTPADGARHWTTDSIVFSGTVADLETDVDLLAVSWSSSIQGAFFSGAPDSSGTTTAATPLAEGTHVITLAATDADGKTGSDTITLQVVDPLNWDDDGDGFTENEGDCDDGNAGLYPGATEQCDATDNDCDGMVNDPWWDAHEPNDSSAAYYDLGEVDTGFLWTGSQISLAGATLHASTDEDWYRWDADDDLLIDNVNIRATVRGLPASGVYVVELYLNEGGTWRQKAGAQGSGALSVTYSGDLFDDDEDEWALRVYARTWPAGSCSTAYTVTIES